MHTAYDDSYGGPAFDPAEGERLAGMIGNKKILMMANHGVTTIAPTVSEAYDLLYYTERAAQVQLYAMQSGRELNVLPQHVIDESIAEFEDRAAIRQQEAACLALRGDEAHPRQEGAGLQKLAAPARFHRRRARHQHNWLDVVRLT